VHVAALAWISTHTLNYRSLGAVKEALQTEHMPEPVVQWALSSSLSVNAYFLRGGLQWVFSCESYVGTRLSYWFTQKTVAGVL
jgi:hypothetical protein